MIYYSRDINKQVQKLRRGFPVLSITGPRQSGKTTYLQNQFPKYTYFNLESPQTLALIEAYPQAFLTENPRNIIIDEVQRYPDLLSYIQVHVDEKKQMGSIILSGSQNLLISERISQSLAGRAAYLTLYPFSLQELTKHQLQKSDHLKQILWGFYPALYTRELLPQDFFNQYIATYVERDARLIRNFDNLSKFRNFLALLAGRVGQVVNVSSLANDTGISPNTAEDWISILEASYLVFRLQPYFANIKKRLIKSPKIYFHDVGLLCALLNINTRDQLKQHHSVGSIFENLVISELVKQNSNRQLGMSLFYFRDSKGNEIDLVIDNGTALLPVEIKSAMTFNASFFDMFEYWRNNVDSQARGVVVNAGEQSQQVHKDRLVGWKQIDNLLNWTQ